jgi:hypothetical protein
MGCCHVGNVSGNEETHDGFGGHPVIGQVVDVFSGQNIHGGVSAQCG